MYMLKIEDFALFKKYKKNPKNLDFQKPATPAVSPIFANISA